MARPVKYRRNVYIIKLPSGGYVFRPEDRIVIEKCCQYCRKPLSNKKIRLGYKYCNHTCANKANGLKARGQSRQIVYRSNIRPKSPQKRVLYD